MRVVVAANALKECVSAGRACEAIASGCERAGAETTRMPLADGGDGSGEILHGAVGGEWRSVDVHGPTGRIVPARYVWNERTRTALIEMARASGLALLTDDEKDPMQTSTTGVGELLLDAASLSPESIIVCVGGSATNDGGAGMAHALGYRFVGDNGEDVTPTGGALRNVRECVAPVDRSAIDAIRRANVTVAVDTDATLVGPRGATAMFARQKGAKQGDVEALERGLGRLASIWKGSAEFGHADLLQVAGAGAAGGLAAGLMAYCGGRLRGGFELIASHVGLDDAVRRADLVITAEGMVDCTAGKVRPPCRVMYYHTRLTTPTTCQVPWEVARVCAGHNVPCAMLTGSLPPGPVLARLERAATAGVFSIAPGPISLQESKERAEALLSTTAAQVVRCFRSGMNRRSALP